MMKAVMLFVTLLLTLHGKPYYAKAEPYELTTYAANVSGQVTQTLESAEGGILGSTPFLRIDDELDRDELEKTLVKLAAMKRMLGVNEKIIANYEKILARKEANYERVKDLDVKSVVEKDREFYDVATTQNQYLSTLKELDSLRVQLADLRLRRAYLEKTIADKQPTAKGRLLYKLMVKPGQVVAPATPVAQLADVSRAKLTLYVTAEDVAGIEAKKIYLDGKATVYRVERAWKVADDQQLSSYRVEIVIDAPERFSQLVKVEFKDE